MVASMATHPVPRYRPVGAARDLVSARDSEVLAVGPAGTGKTLAICWKIHIAASKYPGARILMTRATLESLKPAALTTFANGVQPEFVGVRYFSGNNVRPAEFQYPNGSVIQVSSLEKPEKVKSAEYDIVYVNEATEIPESTWEMLKSRLRNGKMPYQQIIGDCNPAGPKHWLKLRCETPINTDDPKGPTLTRMIASTHKDNPAYWNEKIGDWTEIGRQYVQEVLANLKGVARKRLYQGLWAVAEGVVYPDFAPDMVRPTLRHDVHDYEAPPVDVYGWRTFLTADIGSRNPTAILTLHLRPHDHWIHVSREFYRTDMTSTDILGALKQEADAVNPEAIFIDPSAKQYIDDLKRQGYPAKGANNEIITGIQKVRGVLADGFSIDPQCQNTIDEFGMYAYQENPHVETDKPEKAHDHAMDALRYGVVGALASVDADFSQLQTYMRRQLRGR